ncbi:unnamed protein product [Amoebophrya sp. A25]|nr:unnamed protein product [Amoebophrya sp. A25]|eukprot:GSA25T00012144001.1
MVYIGKYFPIRLPKEVRVENGKLACCQLCVQLLVLSLLAYQFIEERMYLVVRIPQGFPNAWAEVTEASQAAIDKDYNGLICKGDDAFLYRHSENWKHGKYQCIETPSAEAGYKVGKREIYFPTYYRETEARTSSGAGCAGLCPTALPCNSTTFANPPAYNFGQECAADKYVPGMPVWQQSGADVGQWTPTAVQTCTCKKETHFLVAGVASRAMGFEHIFKVDSDDKEVSGSSSASIADANENDNQLPVLTIILQKSSDGLYKEFDCYSEKKARDAGAVSSEDEGKCRFAESKTTGQAETIWMSLRDWVFAASSGSIDLTEPDARNPTISGNTAGPTTSTWRTTSAKSAAVRLTGVEVLISMEYLSPAFHHLLPSSVELGSAYNDHMVAVVKLSVNDAMWTGLPQVAYGSPAPSTVTDPNFNQGTYRERYHYGIRFLFMTSTSSAYGEFSWVDMLTALAVFNIYYAMAGSLVAVFALSALGQLSVQYKRAQQTTLNLQAEASNHAPAKILVAVGAFNQLCKTLQDENPAYVSVQQQNGTVAPMQVFYPKRIDRVVLYRAFLQVFGAGDIKLHGSGIEALVETVILAFADKDGGVDVEKFVNAFCEHEVYDLEQLQKRFDRHREVGFLEDYFSQPLNITLPCLKIKDDSTRNSVVEPQRTQIALPS